MFKHYIFLFSICDLQFPVSMFIFLNLRNIIVSICKLVFSPCLDFKFWFPVVMSLMSPFPVLYFVYPALILPPPSLYFMLITATTLLYKPPSPVPQYPVKNKVYHLSQQYLTIQDSLIYSEHIPLLPHTHICPPPHNPKPLVETGRPFSGFPVDQDPGRRVEDGFSGQ